MITRSTLRIGFTGVLVAILLVGSGADLVFAASGDQELTDVSMIALLASPEKYDGKFIRTMGFVVIHSDSDAIYLHQEDYRFGLYKNSYALNLSEAQRKQFTKFNFMYVLIEGTVHSSSPDATFMCSGTIVKITRLEKWGPWSVPPPISH